MEGEEDGENKRIAARNAFCHLHVSRERNEEDKYSIIFLFFFVCVFVFSRTIRDVCCALMALLGGGVRSELPEWPRLFSVVLPCGTGQVVDLECEEVSREGTT